MLTRYQQFTRLYMVAFGEIQQQVMLAVAPPLRVVIYRRLMLRIAQGIAEKAHAGALVTGDVIGQVASQTLENMATIGSVSTLPVFRPLIGMDKDEIIAEAQRLGTYPISIIEDQDCCQLFTPKHPATKARPDDIEARGAPALPIDEFVRQAVEAAVVEDFNYPGAKIATPVRLNQLEALQLSTSVRKDIMAVQSIGSKIEEILGDEAASLLQYQCKTIPKETLHLPGPDYVERIYSISDRPTRVLTTLQSLLDHGRLAGTGYVSILPVDQGIEHSAGASFAPNPMYFDPENIVKLAIEGGCNAVASTLGVLGSVARKYAHKIPFLLKLNHNEFLSYPNAYDQIKFGSVRQAFEMGAQGVGATIYFGSEESKRQIVEVSRGVPGSPRARHVHRAVVLSAQPGVQDEGQGLPRGRRPDGPGEPPGRDDRGRHHQAEAAGEQRRLQRCELRQDAQEGVLRSVVGPSDRSHALSAGELLHGSRRPDQLRRRVIR